MKNEPFEDVVPYWKSGCSIAMLVYQRVFFWDDHFLFDSPPTTNHQPQQPNCWLKKALLKKNTPFFEAYTKAHKWQHLLENCPTPGNSWSAMHLVEKASAKSWLVIAGSTQKSFFDMYQMMQADPTPFPQLEVTTNFWVRVMEFHSPRKLQGAGKTIVARNLARKNRCNNRWLPKEHLLAYLKMVGKPLQKWHPKKKIQPHIIYTPFLLGIGYIFSLLKGLQQEGLNS